MKRYECTAKGCSTMTTLVLSFDHNAARCRKCGGVAQPPSPPPPRVKRILWFAASGGIAKAGPFDSQVRAWQAIQLSVSAMKELGSPRPFADNAIVWCEEADRGVR